MLTFVGKAIIAIYGSLLCEKRIDWVALGLISLIGARPPHFWGLLMHVRFDTQTGLRADELEEYVPKIRVAPLPLLVLRNSTNFPSSRS